jgi:hypothetical protein
VFCSGVEHWVFGYAYGTSVVTEKWDLGALLTKVSQSVWNPKQLGTTTSGCNILSSCGGLCYTGLLAGRPRNQRRTRKLASTRGRLALHTSISKSVKCECRGGRIPKTKPRSILQIPENPVDSLTMWSPRGSLKTSAQTHPELYVRPRCCQVEEGADHAPILLLVNWFMLIPRLIILYSAREVECISKFINQSMQYDSKVYRTEWCGSPIVYKHHVHTRLQR